MTARRSSQVAAHRAGWSGIAGRNRRDDWYQTHRKVCRICGTRGTPARTRRALRRVLLLAAFYAGFGCVFLGLSFVDAQPLPALFCASVAFTAAIAITALAVTGSKPNPIELHHLRYTIAGLEPDADLVALCRRHHQLVHRQHRMSGRPLHVITRRTIRYRRIWWRLWRTVPSCPWETT